MKVPRLPAALTGALIATQGGSLRSLDVCVPVCGVSGADLGVLAACTQLTALTVEQKRGTPWADNSVGLLRNVRHFPALKVCEP